MDPVAAKFFSASIAVLPLFGVGLGLGHLAANIVTAIGRNPSAGDQIKGAGLLYFALVEAIALFALVVALLILFVF